MLEMQWAMKAYHHAETYFNVIVFRSNGLKSGLILNIVGMYQI